MTIDNLIFIKGGAYSDVKKALQQWVALYSNDLPTDMTFQFFKLGRGKHMIQADKRIDNEGFFYLINYLYYPENIQYKIEIEGFTTGKLDNKLLNKNLLVYIPPTDNEFDNVYISTSENKHFKYEFGSKISEINEGRNYQIPESLSSENKGTVVLNKQKNTRSLNEAAEKNIDKKFKLIAYIAIAALLLSQFILFYDTAIFIKTTYFLGMGLGLWFYIDYELLQSDKNYLYCLISSIVFIGYTILVKNQLSMRGLELKDLGAFYPFVLLITQWPTRRIYLAIFKREPKVDRNGKFADSIYTFILLIGFALLTLFF